MSQHSANQYSDAQFTRDCNTITTNETLVKAIKVQLKDVENNIAAMRREIVNSESKTIHNYFNAANELEKKQHDMILKEMSQSKVDNSRNTLKLGSASRYYEFAVAPGCIRDPLKKI